MTPTEIETAARNKYNAIGDGFFGTSEIFNLIYEACVDLTVDIKNLIENIYTTSTVAAQQEYAYPTLTQSIKRITYEGQKLQSITQREDDAITGLDQNTSSSGTPRYYYEFNRSIFLRPIPDSVGTLKIFSFDYPDTIVASSVLAIPPQFHNFLVNYVVSEMAAKDSNPNIAQYYRNRWDQNKLTIMKWSRMKKRGDSFATVQDETQLNESFLGII